MDQFRRLSACFPGFRTRCRQFGVTLHETVMTLTVTASLAAIAVPSMQEILAHTRVAAAANTLLTALYTGRSEAITRNSRVVLCPSTDQSSCDNRSDWHGGYLLFVDLNGSATREDDEPVVLVMQATSKVIIRSSAFRDHITYQPNGLAYGSNLSFTLCSYDRRSGRAVIVSNSGRARVSTRLPDGRNPCSTS